MAAPDKFGKFTQLARRALNLSEKEALQFSQSYIDTEHLLLGIVLQDDNNAIKVLSRFNLRPEQVRSAVESRLSSARSPTTSVTILGITPGAKKAIALAVDEARQFHHHYVGTEHLLLGLVREGEGIAATVLVNLGVTLLKTRGETIEALRTIATSRTQEQRVAVMDRTIAWIRRMLGGM